MNLLQNLHVEIFREIPHFLDFYCNDFFCEILSNNSECDCTLNVIPTRLTLTPTSKKNTLWNLKEDIYKQKQETHADLKQHES